MNGRLYVTYHEIVQHYRLSRRTYPSPTNRYPGTRKYFLLCSSIHFLTPPECMSLIAHNFILFAAPVGNLGPSDTWVTATNLPQTLQPFCRALGEGVGQLQSQILATLDQNGCRQGPTSWNEDASLKRFLSFTKVILFCWWSKQEPLKFGLYTKWAYYSQAFLWTRYIKFRPSSILFPP